MKFDKLNERLKSLNDELVGSAEVRYGEERVADYLSIINHNAALIGAYRGKLFGCPEFHELYSVYSQLRSLHAGSVPELLTAEEIKIDNDKKLSGLLKSLMRGIDETSSF